MLDDATCTLETLKARMGEFIAERDWQRYHTPKNVAASIAIEAAELLEVFQWKTDAESEPANLDPATRLAAEEEVADVLLYVLSFARAAGIDLSAAVERKMVKNRAKYPAERFQGNYEKVHG